MIHIIIILIFLFIILNLNNKKIEHFDNKKKKYIWLYWENKASKKKPEYLDMCLETFYKNLKDYEIVILNPNNLDKYLTNINPNVHKIKQLAHKADYIRMLATYQHGGFWFDADTIILDDIDLWNNRLKNKDLVWYGMNAYGVNKNNQFIKNVLDKIETKLNNTKTYKFGWKEIGQNIIDPELEKYKKNNPNNFHILSRDEVFFIPFNLDNDKTGSISNNPSVFNEKYKKTQKIIMLHNQLYPDKFKKMSKEAILNSDLNIGKFFKIALKN